MPSATPIAVPPSASIAATPAARCSSFRLAIAMRPPWRAYICAIALPSPVPPPVPRLTSSLNVSGGINGCSTAKGSARAIRSQSFENGIALFVPSRARFLAILCFVQHRYGDAFLANDAALLVTVDAVNRQHGNDA